MTTKPFFYKLDKNLKPYPVDTLEVRDPDFDDPRKRVGSTQLKNGLWVSTIFLFLDHNFFPDGEPILYETMVFRCEGCGESLDQERYHTRAEAVAGHRRMVNRWKNKRLPPPEPDWEDEED